MIDLFSKILFGHLLGDYIFQPKEMAIKKSQKGLRGFVQCFIHCTIYVLSTLIFLFPILNKDNFFIVLFIIFINHFLIDRYSLGQKWLDHIQGRNFINEYNSNDKYRDIQIPFSCIVYVIVDNTFHLLINYYGIKFLLGGI